MTDPSPWWTPSVHADRRPLLIERNRLQAAIRAWFGERGFVEVDPAALQVSPGNETHLHAFATEAIAPDGTRASRYLHTSPEFAMKKLLAAGEERIFAFAHVWRNRERGPLHAPEFTMLEWYRAGAGYDALMEDCAGLLRLTGRSRFTWRGRECDPRLDPERLTVAEAFRRFAGIALTPERDGLRTQMAGMRTADDDTWEDLFSRVIVERIEPNLGIGRPTVLCEYPVEQAALARPAPHDPRVAERFELYCCGVELANGFGELTDAGEQRRRFAADMDEKERIYAERYPIDEDFLAAIAHMPPASGIALGFDRLVMLATGATRIEQIQWGPPA